MYDDRYDRDLQWGTEPISTPNNQSFVYSNLDNPAPINQVRPAPQKPISSNRIMLLAMLSVAFVVTVAAIGYLLISGGSSRTTTATTNIGAASTTVASATAASATVASTATTSSGTTVANKATATTAPLTRAWSAAGPAFAHTITFAPSAPNVAYACGLTNSNNITGNHFLVVATSADGGKTWGAAIQTSVQGVVCEVTVNPTNPRDVVIGGIGCIEGCGAETSFTLGRSSNGGTSFALMALPAGVPADTGVASFAWAGSSFFLALQFSNNASTLHHWVAVSINGGALAWVNEASLFTGINLANLASDPIALYSYNNGVLIVITGILKISRDGGATWVLSSALKSLSGTPTLVDVGGDGKTLMVDSQSGSYYSTNDGKSWQKQPTNIQESFSPIVTPSSIQWGLVRNDGLYQLAVGATSWTKVVSVPTAGELVTIQVDANGHEIAAWANTVDLSNGVLVQDPPGLVRLPLN